MSSLQEKLSQITLPLWKMKLSREEYNELKSILRERIQLNSRRYPYQIEACVYFSQWWLREYSPLIKDGRKGSVSREDVFNSLGIEGDAMSFFRKACEGARMLGIELVSLDSSDRPFYSMFYQGGLPMGNVSSDQTADGWDKFIRGLVLRDYDFSIIPNKSAEKSNSLIAFCDLIKQADDQDDPKLMPFYCEDAEGWSWYQFIHNEIRKGKQKLAEERPFDINWEFTIDHLGHALILDYVIKGPQSLPQGFIDSIDKKILDDIELEITRNNTQVFSVHYSRNILSRKFQFRSSYVNNDVIAIGLKDGKPVLSDSLDLDIPHIICEEKKGHYQLGNKIGTADSYIVFSEEWIPDGDIPILPDSYTYCSQAYRLIHLPVGEEIEVTLRNTSTGDTILFSPRVPLSWTEIYYPEDELNYVFKDPVFDPTSCIVFKKSDKGVEKCRTLLYRAIGAKEWTEIPPVGSFFVRPKDSQYVSPARAVSLGMGYRPKVHSGRDSCSFEIAWKYGRVRPFYGKEVDGKWVITKEDCQGKLIIPCTFTPRDDGRSFDLSLRLPFVDFRIFDFNMNPVCNGDTIPLSDVNIYTYCFAQSGVKDESFRFTLSKTGDKYYAYCDGKKLIISIAEKSYTLPCEGSLESLLGGIEKVTDALGKDGTPLRVSFSDFDFDSKHKYNINIAWRPFEIEKLSNQPILRINENNSNGRVTYVGDLRIFPLDGTMAEPFAVKREDDGTYILPNSTPETFLVSEDNLTSNNGKLRIRMHRLSDVNDADRTRIAIESQRKVYQELIDSPFGGKPWKEALYWFRQSLEYSLTPSKLHHLKLIGANDNLLNFFCFHTFILSEKDEDSMIEDLLELEDGLSFKWWWFEGKNFIIDQSKVNTESFPEVLFNWARKSSIKNNDIEAFKKTIDKDAFLGNIAYIVEFYEKVMNGFFAFKKALVSASKRRFALPALSLGNLRLWGDFIQKEMASLSDYATPEDPMLDYGSDMKDEMEENLFPPVMVLSEFRNYGANSMKFIERVYRLAGYINGKESDVFFNGTAEDIVPNIATGLDRTVRVRESISYYLNKDKESFICHLLHVINNEKRKK